MTLKERRLRFRKVLEGRECIFPASVHDPISARIAESLGFEIEDFTNIKPNYENIVVWWLCPRGHEYDSIISGRTRKDRPRGCPYCSGRRVGKDNNLKFLFPKIVDEWHPTKNGDLKNEDFFDVAAHAEIIFVTNVLRTNRVK